MRKSRTLQKLRKNELVRVCGLGHNIPPFIRQAANFKYDCIWLDLEHRAMDEREYQGLMAFFHLFDIDCMVRVPTLEKPRLYRHLEDGAAGVMVPHVSTPERARDLVQSLKFPPLGERGIDGAGLDAGFGLPESIGYAEEANRETFVCVQIETPEALENADAIAATPGIDVLFVGPADLKLRLNYASSKKWNLESAQKRVAEVCEKHGKAWGRPVGSREEMQALYDMGARVLSHGGEYLAILELMARCQKDFDAIH